VFARPEHHDHAPHRRAGFHWGAVRVVEPDAGLHVPDFGSVVEAEVEVFGTHITWDEQHDSSAVAGFEPCLVHEAEDVAVAVRRIAEEDISSHTPILFKRILFFGERELAEFVFPIRCRIYIKVELIVQFPEYLRRSPSFIFRSGIAVISFVCHPQTPPRSKSRVQYLIVRRSFQPLQKFRVMLLDQFQQALYNRDIQRGSPELVINLEVVSSWIV